MALDPREAVTDKPGALMGLMVLGGCGVALAAAPYLEIPIWKISVAFALALLAILVLRESCGRALRRNRKSSARPGLARPWGVAYPVRSPGRTIPVEVNPWSGPG